MPASNLSFGGLVAQSFAFVFANLRLFFHLVTIPWIASLAIRLLGSLMTRDSLMPVLKLAIANWHAANAMELSYDEQDRRIAFILRSTYVDLVTICAYLVGGREWAVNVALEARRDTSAEGWDAYLAALGNEKRKD